MHFICWSPLIVSVSPDAACLHDDIHNWTSAWAASLTSHWIWCTLHNLPKWSETRAHLWCMFLQFSIQSHDFLHPNYSVAITFDLTAWYNIVQQLPETVQIIYVHKCYADKIFIDQIFIQKNNNNVTWEI